ncbi:MAG: hypothetical protein A3C84_04025 [Candidatus Ryanbacteria bacterium RIFCSPHIGHO2_02_FULL_48_12]|uniref:alanine--tRNA ligase n=1 Tax=Candidatus Ryanbacteria bacterium RIFCSPHIGHO2_01_FULL_48_27 TaxID=1802115 RepID=A0A1G2G137_9BACT|nr:MAG: hypothetical protein A2756_05710 [Candidatus Ryanbacteria bacterium RIFCSPHIGHO2_01_FULL_48_27]OGZ48526.1 MAG: hypothetical protein A3C84_04025 [Candidatus Ryanbacteria bacterium RIFCSPHIGHO2_02_FULL_48_12]
MEAQEIRKRFLEYFKNHGHTAVPSSSLIPDDPSVLLTTAGMQQFKPYYTGKADAIKDFGSLNTASVQKSFRTSDIEEVGDERHLTFFEMLGNFSFGGYFKKEAITFAHEFLTKEMGLEISYVTIFEGKDAIGVPKDEDSRAIWLGLGIPPEKIIEQGMDDVFWGPTGSGGPCGPTTEIYCTNGAGQDIEVWNIVFNEFLFAGSREELNSGSSGKKLEKLPVPGVDTGMGLERLVMVVQKTPTIFETDLFYSLLQLLPDNLDDVKRRVFADHARAMAFLIADGVRPSNKEAGYVLRRLMRRVMVFEKLHKIPPHILDTVIHEIIHMYGDFYVEIAHEANTIRSTIHEERDKFLKTLDRGISELLQLIEKKKQSGDLNPINEISGTDAFYLHQSYGLTEDVLEEILVLEGFAYNEAQFEEERKKHQEISRAGQEGKFGGHGLILDTGELKAGTEEEVKIVTRLHTATHLLQAALRKVLGDDVRQMGSDITPERTRFDFAFSRKVTPEELKSIEQIVNDAIKKDYTVERVEMPYAEADKLGALHFFKEKYPDMVNVYSIVHSKTGEVFSRELCGGPHVEHTGEIRGIHIVKEESSSAGVRRIRAKLE